MSIRFERLVACTKENSVRIAFVGVRVPGHLYPMTTLARKLQARGHEVVFISVLDAEPIVRGAGLSFLPFCQDEYPLGSSREALAKLSRLQGAEALQFSVRSSPRLCNRQCRDFLEP
jgi:UDP:flavonoid glycosyltransferase YjiC (YdhE family)